MDTPCVEYAMTKTVLVTGGAGFISSHLEDLLVKDNNDVISVDVLDPNECSNIRHLMEYDNFHYVKMDVKRIDDLTGVTKECDIIYHLAANSDIRVGGQDPSVDFNETFLTTRSVLESMRINSIPNLFFSSTSAIYGNMVGKLNEITGGYEPISYYGASKLGSEALISAYSFMNDFNALIFRFPNVVGPRLTHGVVFDFIRKLKKNPSKLLILGDGRQCKQYVYVSDLVEAINDFCNKMDSGYNLYNISTESFTDVNTIADLVTKRLGLENVHYEYTGKKCGWKGDVPSFDYDVTKAKNKGWRYKYNSTESVKETLNNLDINSIPPMDD